MVDLDGTNADGELHRSVAATVGATYGELQVVG
jgi:hypothetical protein